MHRHKFQFAWYFTMNFNLFILRVKWYDTENTHQSIKKHPMMMMMKNLCSPNLKLFYLNYPNCCIAISSECKETYVKFINLMTSIAQVRMQRYCICVFNGYVNFVRLACKQRNAVNVIICSSHVDIEAHNLK